MSMPAGEGGRWFAVRCLFAVGGTGDADVQTYEERITLWRATGFDEAIALAEAEAVKYAAVIEDRPDTYLGLAQCYEIADEIGNGAEVFSLIRDSQLSPGDYLSAFFDSGGERQRADRS